MPARKRAQPARPSQTARSRSTRTQPRSGATSQPRSGATSQPRSAATARARSDGWRKEQQRRERNRRFGLIGLAVVLVVVVALVVVLVFVQRAGQKADTRNLNSAAPTGLAQNLASVPASLFDQVGTSGLGRSVAGLKAVSGTPDLTDGKPTLIYVGGEFCPYCAAQRWVLVTALDRFGSFTGLQTTRSAANDGNFATLTFVHATYTSKYVAFDGKEIFDRARNKLQTLSKTAQASYAKYGSVGSVPYFSVNNAYTGSYQYEPQELGTSSATAIAAQIRAGKTMLAKNVIAGANILTAALCKQTGGKPATVCTSAGAVSGAKGL